MILLGGGGGSRAAPNKGTPALERYFESNRRHWNEATSLQASSAFNDLERFRSGASTLRSIELEELGDVSGKSLLHTQCNFGLDTMSWARLGADVTGVDFSDNAIELARSLSRNEAVDAEFVLSNVYDLPDVLDASYGIVFASYGVLYHLPDLRRWAEIMASLLKPGGTFYIVDFHRSPTFSTTTRLPMS